MGAAPAIVNGIIEYQPGDHEKILREMRFQVIGLMVHIRIKKIIKDMFCEAMVIPMMRNP